MPLGTKGKAAFYRKFINNKVKFGMDDRIGLIKNITTIKGEPYFIVKTDKWYQDDTNTKWNIFLIYAEGHLDRILPS